jgi:TonB family protein
LRDRASEWLDADAQRRRVFRRWVAASALGHGLLLAALLWAPRSPSEAQLPGVVTVDLVAMAAPAAARTSPAAPLPAPPAPAQPEPPKPPPPLPPKAEVVIPKNPEREPEKPKQKAEPEPKPEPEKPKEVARPKPAPPRPEAAKPDYDDVLASLRAERGETRPERIDRSAASAPAAGSPHAAAVTPEVAGWLRAARMAVRQAWVLPAGFRKQPLETHVTVDLDAQGNVLSDPKVTQHSGNPWYDESVVRAIQKASPLPAPPEPGAWSFVFRPEDLT